MRTRILATGSVMDECLPNRLKKALLRERLFEQMHLTAHQALVRDHILGIAGHVEDGEAWTRLVNARGQVHSRHLGHDDISEDKVDLSRRIGAQSDRVRWTCRLEYAVAVLAQDPTSGGAQRRLVLDEQDAFAAAGSFPARLRRFRDRRRGLASGKQDRNS